MTYILAIDQGTTSSRAIVFDQKMQPVASAQEDFEQLFPASGWVEHRPSDIWETVLRTCKAALAEGGISGAELAGIGIANQRETTLLWDRSTGVPLHNAIVWQDRRTADMCEALKDAGHEEQISYATGLLLDPYFSGTKLAWLLDNVEGARARAEAGELAFGTVDSWLLWNLTGGHVHATDATNAARTLLYDIREGTWSEDICALLDIPLSLLPEVHDCASEFGSCELFGKPVPVLGVAGDQQAATIGQGCFSAGMMKSTYGTGCFALLNTGASPVRSQNRLLTTIAYQFDGVPTYALEGSIFVAGAVVQWLRDGLKLIDDAKETQGLAEDAEEGVILVPAFTGLGAPFWNAGCRGAVFGLTRNTGPREMARAALESVGFQTRDLLEAMRADWARSGADLNETALRVDGGMTASDWTMQFLSDMTGAQVDRPMILETTALGAAWLAGHRAGLYPDQEGFAQMWQLDRNFEPQMDLSEREKKYASWQRAIAAAQSV